MWAAQQATAFISATQCQLGLNSFIQKNVEEETQDKYIYGPHNKLTACISATQCQLGLNSFIQKNIDEDTQDI